MSTHSLISNLLLLAFFFVVTACNNQIKTEPTKSNNYQQPLFTDYHPKVIRTQGVTSGNLNCELMDKEGNHWFSTDGEGIYRFDGKTFTNFTAKEGLCDNNACTIIQDKTGNILIGTNKGICKYDGKSFSKYFEADSLNKIRITALMEDREGNLWFSAMNKGVYRYDDTSLTNI